MVRVGRDGEMVAVIHFDLFRTRGGEVSHYNQLSLINQHASSGLINAPFDSDSNALF